MNREGDEDFVGNELFGLWEDLGESHGHLGSAYGSIPPVPHAFIPCNGEDWKGKVLGHYFKLLDKLVAHLVQTINCSNK